MTDRLRFALAIMLGLLAPTPSWAQTSPTDQAIAGLLGDPVPYRAAILELQQAIRSHDASAVAALVGYPFQAMVAGRKLPIADARAFIQHYDEIVTAAVAGAVQDRRYDDLLVNAQGVMLGQGEIWLNGICRDRACKSSDVSVITIQAGPDQLQAAGTLPPEPKAFRDWVVGCDNLLGCTALGLARQQGDHQAYLVITRAGGADEPPKLSLTVLAKKEAKAPALGLTLDGQAAGGMGTGALRATRDGDFITVTLSIEQTSSLIGDLLTAKVLTLDLLDGARRLQSEDVSLSGSAAALLYMDDAQHRVGTVTALARRGDAPASSIPVVSAMPVLKARRLVEIGKVPRPAGLPRTKAVGCKGIDDLAFMLDERRGLWGLCSDAGAYNLTYRFFITGDGPPRPAAFVFPGEQAGKDSSELVNPNLAEDGLRLNSHFKDEGIGDCGQDADWIWDGQGFQLSRLRELAICRGVASDDWPLRFQAGLD